MKMFPVSKLGKWGVKVTLKVQAAPAASVAGEMGQLFGAAKSGLGLTEMLRMVSAPLPVLVSVSICAALVVPTNWLGKVRLVGEKLTTPVLRP
jgi:hypothetical protein